MDDRMLDGDRVLWFIGGSPERAQEALAAGHAWTPEQRAQLEQIAASAGYSPQQPAGYPPAQQQVPVQEPAPVYGAPAQPAAFDGVFGGDGAHGGTVDYGAAQPTQPAQQPAAVAPLLGPSQRTGLRISEERNQACCSSLPMRSSTMPEEVGSSESTSSSTPRRVATTASMAETM